MADIANQIVYQLKTPLKFGDNLIKEVIISEPTYKILRNCDMTDEQQLLKHVLESCNNLPEGLFDDITIRDYIGLVDGLGKSNFLG